MPGYAVRGCKNSSRQGVKMNRLPRDLIKRKKFITNCEKFDGMENWSPLDTATLCEVFFLILINIYIYIYILSFKVLCIDIYMVTFIGCVLTFDTKILIYFALNFL